MFTTDCFSSDGFTNNSLEVKRQLSRETDGYKTYLYEVSSNDSRVSKLDCKTTLTVDDVTKDFRSHHEFSGFPAILPKSLPISAMLL